MNAIRPILALIFLAAPGFAQDNTVVSRFIAHAAAHPDGEAPFTFDASAFSDQDELKHLPIGVFDSGMGGLTVLEAILSLDAFHNDTLRPGADGRPDFERERFLYFGDKANMPYGNYAAEGRGDYLRELILKDAAFLLGRRWRETAAGPVRLDKAPVKAIVIACNTATAAGLDDLRAALAAWKLPVIVVGVVEAGARGVLESRREKDQDGSIAVLATVGTCATGAYPRLIQQTLGRAGRPSAEIVQQGSAALAGVIEGDPGFSATVQETARADVKALLEARPRSASSKPIDLVVLGCTHFPLARTEIDAAFAHWRNWENPAGERPYASLIAPERTYVDPAEWTARELFRELASARLRSPDGESAAKEADRFFYSVPHPALPAGKLTADRTGLDAAHKYGRETGQYGVEDTVNVPFGAKDLPVNLQSLLRDRLPAVWHRLQR